MLTISALCLTDSQTPIGATMKALCKTVHYRRENQPTDRLTQALYIVRGENGAVFRDTSETLATIFAQWLHWQGYSVRASIRYVSPLRVCR